MFIFQHISSFISLIHPLSAVFISEETECRTFVIENKSISFSIFNYQFLIIKSMALNYSVSLRTNPIKKDEPAKAYATAQINGELSLKQLSRRVSMQTTVSRADVVAVFISTVENLMMPSKRGNRWISANWVNSGSISSTRVRRVLRNSHLQTSPGLVSSIYRART